MTIFYADGFHRTKSSRETFNVDLNVEIKNFCQVDKMNIRMKGGATGKGKSSFDSVKLNGGNK